MVLLRLVSSLVVVICAVWIVFWDAPRSVYFVNVGAVLVATGSALLHSRRDRRRSLKG